MDGASEQASAVLKSGFNDPEALALLGTASAAAGQDSIAEAAFKEVLAISKSRRVDMRRAAHVLAVGRVAEAQQIRGLWP